MPAATALVEEQETPWIDAWIRWERDSKDIVDEEEEEEEEDVGAAPTATFSFSYELPLQDLQDLTSDNDDSQQPQRRGPRKINLELKGFPPESEQIWNSTGLTSWPCSHHLCDYLVSHPDLLGDKRRIVELGSGLGRCGLLVYHLLSSTTSRSRTSSSSTAMDSHVFLTDGDTDTLRQLRQNVDHNINNSPSDRNCNPTGISCHQLLWGEKAAIAFCQRHGKDNEEIIVRIDDRGENSQSSTSGTTTTAAAGMDLVLGSDLVYVPSVIEPLFETACALLGDKPNGVFLMAHSNRRQGSSVTLQMVLEGAQTAKMDHQIILEEGDFYVMLFRKHI